MDTSELFIIALMTSVFTLFLSVIPIMKYPELSYILMFLEIGILISIIEAIHGNASPKTYVRARRFYSLIYLFIGIFYFIITRSSISFYSLTIYIPYFLIALDSFSDVKEKLGSFQLPNEIIWIPSLVFFLSYVYLVVFLHGPIFDDLYLRGPYYYSSYSKPFFELLAILTLLLSSFWLLHRFMEAKTRFWFSIIYLFVGILTDRFGSPTYPLLALGFHGFAEIGLSKNEQIHLKISRRNVVKSLAILFLTTIILYAAYGFQTEVFSVESLFLLPTAIFCILANSLSTNKTSEHETNLEYK